tara:strand:+ start:85 stop:462 length:378 start_codon:yes stop_codon:yes gene_type:complete
MEGYEQWVADIGLTQLAIDSYIFSNEHNVLEFKNNTYHKGRSKIHATGVFASKNINKKEIIGLGSIDGIFRTTLGRYTNHSNNNNAMFYILKNKDTIMIAEKDINKGEEILVNYGDHTIRHEEYL